MARLLFLNLDRSRSQLFVDTFLDFDQVVNLSLLQFHIVFLVDHFLQLHGRALLGMEAAQLVACHRVWADLQGLALLREERLGERLIAEALD